jgi:hypothetical protein
MNNNEKKKSDGAVNAENPNKKSVFAAVCK